MLTSTTTRKTSTKALQKLPTDLQENSAQVHRSFRPFDASDFSRMPVVAWLRLVA